MVGYNGLPSVLSPAVQENMDNLRASAYPGRLVAAGINFDERSLLLATATMGRSVSSRTRTYESNGAGDVLTVPFGEEVDPLTVYRTMTSVGVNHIATNGSQTNAIARAIRAHGDLQSAHAGIEQAARALSGQYHEPDSLHTPRISVVAAAGLSVKYQPALFSVITSNPERPDDSKASLRNYYQGYLGSVVARGTGLAVTTYAYPAEGDPTSFEGAPKPIAMGNDAEETAAMLADTLDMTGGHLVSIAVKEVSLRTGSLVGLAMFNKYGSAPNWPQAA